MKQVSFGKIYKLPYNESGNQNGCWKMHELETDLKKTRQLEIDKDEYREKVECDSFSYDDEQSVALLYVNDGYDRYQKEIYLPDPEEVKKVKQKHIDDSISICFNTTAQDILEMEKKGK